MRHYWNIEEKQFLINNVKGITLRKLTKLFNEKFNCSVSESSVANQKIKLNLSSGIKGGQFKKGHIPANKGKKWDDYVSKEKQKNSLKTCFKKGNIPHNHRKVGEERTTKEGYIEIKIEEPNKWQLKHRYIYEKKFGKIPDGYNVIFLDGNKKNLEISNLKLVNKAEDLIMNNNRLFTKDKELTNTGTIIAKVIYETSKLKR